MPGSVVICVSGWWRHFQGGLPRPVVHAPVPWLHPHVKTVPQSEMRRNMKRKGENGIANSNLTETQNKSSVENKLVDMAMENMYCKIIAFALFHLYFAILYFCLQNLFFSCNTSFFLQFFIFVCKTYFLLAILNFLWNSLFLFTKSTFIFSQYFHFRLQCFNSLANIYGIVLTPKVWGMFKFSSKTLITKWFIGNCCIGFTWLQLNVFVWICRLLLSVISVPKEF